MTDALLGIGVSKNTFDTNLGDKGRSKSFTNSPDGWHHLIAWRGKHKIGQVHACLLQQVMALFFGNVVGAVLR